VPGRETGPAFFLRSSVVVDFLSGGHGDQRPDLLLAAQMAFERKHLTAPGLAPGRFFDEWPDVEALV
jgi:hypothetical protein